MTDQPFAPNPNDRPVDLNALEQQSRHRYNDQHDPDHERTLEDDKGTLPFYLLPLAFFFQPTRFMRSWGAHIADPTMFAIIWITGASSAAGFFENNVTLAKRFAWVPKSWLEFFIAITIVGLLRGMVIYALGTLWFRARLHLSGSRNHEWRDASRAYMIPGIAKHTFGLLYLISAALRYDSFTTYTQSGGFIEGLLVLVTIFILQIWSSVTLTAAVFALFQVKRAPALVWFLILPVLLRLLGFAALAIGLTLLSMNPGAAQTPLLDQPSSHTNETFTFEYPLNWSVETEQPNPGPITWASVDPFIADAFIEFGIYHAPNASDTVYTIHDDLTQRGFEQTEEPRSINKLFNAQGFGLAYAANYESNTYTIKLLATPLDEYACVYYKIIAHQDAYDKIEPGFEHIVRTLRTTDPAELTPNTRNPYTIDTDDVTLQMPSNWWYIPEHYPEITDDDGTRYPASTTLTIETPGWGRFIIYIYESDLTPEEELALTIESYTDQPTLESQQPLTQWLGLNGTGAQGTFHYDDVGPGTLKALIVPIDNHRFAEFRLELPNAFTTQHAPGFQLIESTLKLKHTPKPTTKP